MMMVQALMLFPIWQMQIINVKGNEAMEKTNGKKWKRTCKGKKSTISDIPD